MRAIYDFIARDSKVYAQRLIERIKSRVEGIVFPDAGAIVPEWNRLDVREAFVANFRIICRIKPDVIEVLTIIHAARFLPGEIDIDQK